MSARVVSVIANVVHEVGNEVVVRIYNASGFTLAFVDRRLVEDYQGDHAKHIEQFQEVTSN